MKTVKEIAEKRRAVNFFDSSVAITDDDLRSIYEIAKLSPSSFNLQPWRVIVVRSPEKRERLRELAMNQPKVTEASAILVFVGRGKAYEEDVDRVLRDRVSKGYMSEQIVDRVKEVIRNLYGGREVAFASRNVGLFAMLFMLAAESEGWDTHPMDGFDVEGVREFLQLGEGEFPVMMMALGKKQREATLLPRPERKSFEEVFSVL
ncbi:MAG: nitroreductase family protein [Syntrophobacterales bacterium]|nr:nitroreductase family protein [Syntrophobacterales bacterium]